MRSVAGLFGKLPAHGDFIRRGWPGDTVDAVDCWLTDGMAAMRETRDDEAFVKAMHAAPLWQGYVPPGLLGPLALHLAVAPSIDRAGRLFPLAAGRAGEGAWSDAAAFGALLDPAIYEAIGGRIDADALIDLLDAAPAGDEGLIPAASAWWPGVPAGEPAIESDAVDTALLVRLLCPEPA